MTMCNCARSIRPRKRCLGLKRCHISEWNGAKFGRELEEFLASLPDRAAAESEKQSAKQLGSFLREQALVLNNADFFSHQLRERLDRESGSGRSERDAAQTGWWTIRRLLWGGITS